MAPLLPKWVEGGGGVGVGADGGVTHEIIIGVVTGVAEGGWEAWSPPQNRTSILQPAVSEVRLRICPLKQL